MGDRRESPLKNPNIPYFCKACGVVLELAALFVDDGCPCIGSTWFERHVRGNAFVLGLSPRMTFDGMPPNPKTGKIDPYPKDLMLSVFGFGLHGFDTWRWT